MINIDGGTRSGSGTIVRYSVALASLLGKKIRIQNIRAGRDKPGLRAQHLKVVQACREMCHGMVENASVGSKEIAPSAYHMKFVLLPFLKQMGVRVELDIIRPGYVPRGGGIIEVRVEPV